MTKYLKIVPDHRALPCRCNSGDPDCDHLGSCHECGIDFRPFDGHDCLDCIDDAHGLLDAAKELRDSLDACETERDKAVKSLQKAGYTDCGGELWNPPIGPSASPLLEEIDRLRAQLAAIQSVPQGVDVPDLVYLHEEWSLVRGVGGDPEWDAAVFGAGYNLAKSRARLVPTPPQADAVVALTDDMIRREWCNLHSGVEGDPDESAYSAFEEGVRQGFSLRAQPTNNETRG